MILHLPLLPLNAYTHRTEPFPRSNQPHTSICIYGIRSLTLNIGLRHTFSWAFIVPYGQKLILSTNFLHYFSQLVDIKNHQLQCGLRVLHIYIGYHCSRSLSQPLFAVPWTSQFFNPFPWFPFRYTTMNLWLSYTVQNVTHYRTTGPPVSVRLLHLKNNLKLSVMSFKTWSNWALSSHLPAVGYHPYIWYPSKHQLVTDTPEEITVP